MECTTRMSTDRHRAAAHRLVAIGLALVAAGAAIVVCSAPVQATPSTSPSGSSASSSAAPSGSAVSSEETTFGIQAATATGPDQRPNFVFGGGPGVAPFHDYVSVLNIGSQPLTLSLYAADAQATSNGQFSVKLQGNSQSDVGSWISLGAGPTVTIPARTAAGPSRILVPFSLKIPASASPGDHVGAILVSLHTAAGTGSRASEALDQRVGIRVYVRVSGTVHASLTVQKLSAGFSPFIQANPVGSGKVTVSYVVRNTGNVILGASQTVSVSGLFGTEHASGLAQIPALLPGSSVTIHATVRGVFPAFHDTAKVSITPEAPVGAVDPGLKRFSKSTSVWAAPWTLIVLIVVLVPLGTWYLRRRIAPGGSHSGGRRVLVGAGR